MASPRVFRHDGAESRIERRSPAGEHLFTPAEGGESGPSPTISITQLPAARPRRFLELVINGVRMQHLDVAAVTDQVAVALEGRILERAARPLAIGSVNLDHLFHFGTGRGEERLPAAQHDSVRWLMLIDGSPVARRARACTGVFWPRLTGADLLPDLLATAEAAGARVGFLGGSPVIESSLRDVVAREWPDVRVAGVWTPPRDVVDDPDRSAELAREIAAADVDLLVVGLGKPRQEDWIARHGVATQAKVLTAFGAAADFLAGSAPRAPLWMRRFGIEWTYRLAREPRRLWRRYLVQGPIAMRALLGGAVTIDYVALPGGDSPR